MRRYRTNDKLASATGSRRSVDRTTGITTGTTSRLRCDREHNRLERARRECGTGPAAPTGASFFTRVRQVPASIFLCPANISWSFTIQHFGFRNQSPLPRRRVPKHLAGDLESKPLRGVDTRGLLWGILYNAVSALLDCRNATLLGVNRLFVDKQFPWGQGLPLLQCDPNQPGDLLKADTGEDRIVAATMWLIASEIGRA